MDEPDFDVDDLIDDYVDDYEAYHDAPPQDELDYMEQMMTTEDNANTNTNITANTTANFHTDDNTNEVIAVAGNISRNATSSNSIDITTTNNNDSNGDDGDNQEATAVRDYIAQRTEDSQLYNFERFQKSNTWRQTPLSPNHRQTATAKGWKSACSDLFQSNLTPAKRHATAPDAQLLELLHQRHSAMPTLRLKRAWKSPREEQETVPLTLADGHRVYLSTATDMASSNATNPYNTSNHTNDKSCALGVSISELKRRAAQIRRMAIRRAGTTQRGTRSNTVIDQGQLWVDKHAPSAFSHLLSDERTNREVLRALRAWDKYVFGRDPPPRPAGLEQYHQDDAAPPNSNPQDKRPEEHQRVILLSGPPGVGKTTLAHILVRKAGYRPLEVNGSDERSASVLTDRVRRAMESSTLMMTCSVDAGKPNCLILDEIDGADAKGSIQAIVELIRADIPATKKKAHQTPYLRRPIIFICNHRYATALRPLLPFCKHFHVDPPSPSRLVARLKAVLTAEAYPSLGGSLLHQLVQSSGGDIRSCLYTLQFAAAQATDAKDLQQSLANSLGGAGLKDGRSDLGSALTAVFRKLPRRSLFGSTRNSSSDRDSIARVYGSVEGLGDNSSTINALFLNVNKVSYIDPTMDRCAAAHEWLSGADLFRSMGSHDNMAQYALQRLHMPSAAAALHILCRVERKPHLSVSTRELTETHYQRQEQSQLVKKFSEGLPPATRNLKGVSLLVTEVLPLLKSILAADGALSRAASSLDVLMPVERARVQSHTATLVSLGLTYVADTSNDEDGHRNGYKSFKSQNNQDAVLTDMRLEPPVDRWISYGFDEEGRNRSMLVRRKAIPAAMKQLLAQQVRLERLRGNISPSKPSLKPNESSTTATSSKAQKPLKPVHVSPTNDDSVALLNPSKIDELAKMVPTPSKSPSPTATNFLGRGAKRAREAKAARKAAALGLSRKKQKKAAHTGSGLLLSQVLRLKYVKGFTQAVRTPCRKEDMF